MRNKNYAFRFGSIKHSKHLKPVSGESEIQLNNQNSPNKFFEMGYIFQEPKFCIVNNRSKYSKRQSISPVSTKNEEKSWFAAGTDLKANRQNEIKMQSQLKTNPKSSDIKLINFDKNNNEIIIHSRKSSRCRLVHGKNSSSLQQKTPKTEKQRLREEIIFGGNYIKIVKPDKINNWRDMRPIHSEMTVMSRMLSTREYSSLQRNRELMATKLSFRHKLSSKTAIGLRSAKQKFKNDRPWSPLNSDEQTSGINNQSGIASFFSLQP